MPKKQIDKKQEKMKKICFIISIIGILILLFLTTIVKPKEINICNLNQTKENDFVVVFGKIIYERNLTETFTSLTLQNSSCKIDITCNCNGFLGKNVSVVGKIEYYQNKTQINADKIQIT